MIYRAKHDIMHHNTIMTFRYWIIAACLCYILGVGAATATPIEKAAAAYDKGNYAQTIKILKPLAVQGNANAQYFLGSMYENGQGVTQDYREAVKWYRQSAMQGDVNGQLALGAMYRNGIGVTKDHQEALKWYRLAAEQEVEPAKEALKHSDMVAAAQNLATAQTQSKQPQRLASNGTKIKAEWVPIDTGNNGAFTGYADLSTIRKTGNKVKMSNLWDYKNVQEISGSKYLSMEEEWEYDCKQDQMKLLNFSWFRDSMGKGNAWAISFDSSPSEWRRVMPNGMGESLLRVACGDKQL